VHLNLMVHLNVMGAAFDKSGVRDGSFAVNYSGPAKK
jgi:hypothetical protein